LGLEAAQALADFGLFDTPLSDPTDKILLKNPIGAFPVTDQVGQTLLPFQDDLDPVKSIESDSNILSMQSRRMVSVSDFDLSFGVEYGHLKTNSDLQENVFIPVGLIGLVELAAPSEIEFLDFEQSFALASDQESSSELISGHAQMRWGKDKGWLVEAGVFPSEFKFNLRSDVLGFDNSETDQRWDTRVGIGYRANDFQFRAAHQVNRAPIGVDTIAPVGTLGLVPNRELGFSAGLITSQILRLDKEFSDKMFVSLEAEYQDIEESFTSRPRERAEALIFTLDGVEVANAIDNAELLNVSIEANMLASDNLGVSAGVGYLSHKNKDVGLSKNNDIPLVPRHTAFVSANYISPSFWRASASINYIGKRYADVTNQFPLDDAVTGTVGVTAESRDKAWEASLNVSGVISDRFQLSESVNQEDFSLSFQITRKW
jgi:hypothetical protein